MSILNEAPARGAVPSQADWYILYSAGSGAIFQCLRMEQYGKAANLAERIANWHSGQHGSGRPGGPMADKFAEWAASIRRTHPED